MNPFSPRWLFFLFFFFFFWRIENFSDLCLQLFLLTILTKLSKSSNASESRYHLLSTASLSLFFFFWSSSPNPLVVYVFSEDEKFKKKVFEQTRAGAFVVNETLIHPGGSFLSALPQPPHFQRFFLSSRSAVWRYRQQWM